jgi:hypothetical protein
MPVGRLLRTLSLPWPSLGWFEYEAFPWVKSDEVCAEMRRRIDEMAPRGGYFAAPSYSAPYDSDQEQTMRDDITAQGCDTLGKGA